MNGLRKESAIFCTKTDGKRSFKSNLFLFSHNIKNSRNLLQEEMKLFYISDAHTRKMKLGVAGIANTCMLMTQSILWRLGIRDPHWHDQKCLKFITHYTCSILKNSYSKCLNPIEYFTSTVVCPTPSKAHCVPVQCLTVIPWSWPGFNKSVHHTAGLRKRNWPAVSLTPFSPRP